MENKTQVILIVLWALLALASFAGGIFAAMPLVWRIISWVFGIYNCLIIFGIGYVVNKGQKDE